MGGIIELTEESFTVQREVCGYLLQVSVKKIGQDLLVSVEGGQKPHIGCVIQSVSRPSLTGDGSYSATSSVMNLTGHKDEYLPETFRADLCRMQDYSGMYRRCAY